MDKIYFYLCHKGNYMIFWAFVNRQNKKMEKKGTWVRDFVCIENVGSACSAAPESLGSGKGI